MTIDINLLISRDQGHTDKVDITVTGRQTRVATWDDLSKIIGSKLDSTRLSELIEKAYCENETNDATAAIYGPQRPTPKRCSIDRNRTNMLKSGEWKPVHLCLETHSIEILESTAKSAIVSKSTFARENTITSTLAKSKNLEGHALSSSVSSKTSISFDFEGFDAVVAVASLVSFSQ